MNTLKSTAVILVLAGVLYGVYTALNQPEAPPPPGMTKQDIDEMAPPDIDFGGAAASTAHLPAPPTTLTPATGSSPAAGLHADHDHSPSHDESSSTYAPPTGTSASPTTEAPASPALRGPESSAAGQTYNQKSSFESAAPPAASPSLAAFALRRDLALAEQQIAENKFRDALSTLSPHYHRAELPSEDRAALIAWLDALAAKVVYSREHWLQQAYEIRGSETLFDIAQRIHVPAELLQNINGLGDPRVVVPGTKLKLVPGPMRAEVNLTSGELTVFVSDLYAGRFPFTLGNEPPQPGDYEVKDRQPERTYYGPDGRTIPANDPTNPYGQCWIDLGPAACIHGSPTAANVNSPALGCICLSPQDARDVYSILARGSRVSIKR